MSGSGGLKTKEAQRQESNAYELALLNYQSLQQMNEKLDEVIRLLKEMLGESA